MTSSEIHDEWDLVYLGPIDSIFTQSLWHAAAQLRSSGELKRNILSINWPTNPIVSCGYHQVVSQVVDLEYCAKNNLPIVRRAVGGGSVYLDSNQLFYHFIWHNESSNIPRNISEIFKTFLSPVVATYQDFGVDAQYKPVNDILCNNRKISGNGAGMFGYAQVLVGNFILDFPRKEMSNIFRVPDEKFRDKVYKSLQDGISSFKDELGYIPKHKDIFLKFKQNIEDIMGIELIDTELHPSIEKDMRRLKEVYLTKEWLFEVEQSKKRLIDAVKIHGSLNVSQGMHKSQGGLIKALCEFQNSILTDLLLSGDFWITPNKLTELADFLRGTDIIKDNLPTKIQYFLDKEGCETSGTSAADIAQAIRSAYDLRRK